MQKGKCGRKTNFFRIVTVTDKGQIAIPVELRKTYNISKGDKLIAVKRNDNKGFNLLKLDVMGDFINKISND
jgi:AbrB family looped-hinge helix DNA binding protein